MRHSAFVLLFTGALLAAACDGPTGGTDASGPADPPETAAREIALGQAVQESLASTTDVDAFAVSIPAAGMGVVRLRGTEAGTGQGALRISVGDSLRHRSRAVLMAHGTDEGVLRFPLPAGRVIVTVESAGGQGGYTFTLDAVNVGPEAVDSVIPRRQWVHDALAPYWDLDEFVFDGVAGEEISLWIEAEGGMHTLALFAPASYGGDSIAGTATWFGGHVEPFALPATGRYRLRVRTPAPLEPRFASPYRVMVFPVDRAPEGVPAELRHATPVAEELDTPDDVDVYTFTADAGEMFQFSVRMAAGAQANIRLTEDATGDWLFRDGRVVIPRAGEYHLTFSGGHGAYELEMFRIDPAPEAVPARIQLGELVDRESLDPSEDIDTFEFAGRAGTEVVMMAHGLGGHYLRLLHADRDSVMEELLVFRSGSDPEANASRRVRLPADGTYRVKVGFFADAESVSSRETVGAPYRLRVDEVNYAPEAVSAALVVGDTVVAESLEHRADVDTYTFHATAGDRLTLWGTPELYNWSGKLVMMVNPADDLESNPVAYIWSGFAARPHFVAEATGTYVVRVASATAAGLHPTYTDTYRGPYRVAILRRP